MSRSRRSISQRAVSLAITIGIVGASAVTLTGCSADPRIAIIEDAVRTAVADTLPYLIGAQTGDVAKALSEAGDSTTVQVSVRAPDLRKVNETVSAESNSEELYRDADSAADALADSGKLAWEKWLEANRDSVEYIEAPIKVIVTGDKESVTAEVDKTALRSFGRELELADLKLFVRAAEDLPQWRRTMVAVHGDDFLGEITGLPTSLVSEDAVQVESVEPAGDDLFKVVVSHADAAAVFTLLGQKAVESYGTGKIWGAVTKDAFAKKMYAVVDDVKFDLDRTQETTATVKLVVGSDKATMNTAASLAVNLKNQWLRYETEVQPGSFTAPVAATEARAKAIDAGVKELSKRAIPEQKQPSTGRLLAGASGQPVTVKVGRGANMHVTFFRWGTNQAVVSAFVWANATLTVRVPTGDYRLVYAKGSSWYGQKYSYGPKGDYNEFKASATSTGPMKVSISGGYAYQVGIGTGGGSAPAGSTDNPFEK